MKGYLGETDVSDQHEIGREEGALLFIDLYGGIDGSHHKDWVLDQVVRILHGAPITVKEARWTNRQAPGNGYIELRYSVGTSDEYEQYVHDYQYGGGDELLYEYSTGIAP